MGQRTVTDTSNSASAAIIQQVAATARQAAAVLRSRLEPTPVREALAIDPSGQLYLKLESFQPTGSFKIRGATYRIETLDAEQRAAGVVAASTGNHGAAVAHAARAAGVKATVVLPVNASPARVAAIESRGAEVIRHGAECGAAELHARSLAEASGRVFLSPYNDAIVMAGQGSMGVELLEQFSDLDRVYIAVGGGGLIGGVACAIKSARPEIEIVGCSPEASYPMHASVAAGCMTDTPHLETLSVATAGGLEEGTVTLAPCAAAVDRWELVGEEAISSSTFELITKERMLVEGAVGVPLAVWTRDRDAGLATGKSCIVVCGGNLDSEHLAALMARHMPAGSSAASSAGEAH